MIRILFVYVSVCASESVCVKFYQQLDQIMEHSQHFYIVGFVPFHFIMTAQHKQPFQALSTSHMPFSTHSHL